MAKALVLYKPNILNRTTYYKTSNVFVKYYDTYRDKYPPLPHYPYINYNGEAFAENKKSYIATDIWKSHAKVLRYRIVDLESFSTLEYARMNSNIYKNIFSHLLFDIYSIQNKFIIKPNKRLNEIVQFNHNFKKYDLVYIDQYGFYHKGIANSKETYGVVGIIYNVINNYSFVLMTNGIMENIFEFESDSGILYLSDTEPGKFTTYENIHSMLYTPIGFYNDDKIIINILDSSIGYTLGNYQKNFISQDLLYLSEQDRNEIIQEVLDNI